MSTVSSPLPLPLSVRGKLYSIPASSPFIETLARGILEQAEQHEFALTEWLIFLPTRRACGELRQKLLRLSAGAARGWQSETAHAVLLPRLLPLGDTGEEETQRETVSAQQRRLLLAQLIEAWLDVKARQNNESSEDTKTSDAKTSTARVAQSSLPVAVGFAQALARLQEDFALEETNPAETLTADLVPDNCAAHWRDALDFLRIVTEHWQRVLEERNLHDPAVERVRNLSRQAESIADRKTPVVVAGSTGSLKATARLMRAVLDLEQGQVVLAGCPAPLDDLSRDTLFEEKGEGIEPTHPFHPFRTLFASWNMEQEQVARLLQRYPAAPLQPCHPRRVALLTQAFSKRPAPLNLDLLTDALPDALPDALADALPDALPDALAPSTGLTILPCRESQEEADFIALILREALEEKGQRAALVTRDRTLARRVRCALKGHWNLSVEDTAQQPLAESHAAQLFLLLLKALVPENNAPPQMPPQMPPKNLPLDIVALKALFARVGGEAARAWQSFEASVLRKADRLDPTKTQRAATNLYSLKTLLDKSHGFGKEKAALLTQALATLTPLAEQLSGERRTTRADLLCCHQQCAENFVALCSPQNTEEKTRALYQGEGGAELQRFCDTLAQHWQENNNENDEDTAQDEAQDEAQDYAQDDAQDYLSSLEALLARESRRGQYATHPRLAILGPLEARLLSFDLLVLGGMTEGSWPVAPDKSPFLPESLRTKVGLKPLEHNIGLSALDFLNFASMPQRVIATFAARHNGQPRQPSRFLQRLQACDTDACRNPAREEELRRWLDCLQRGEKAANAQKTAPLSVAAPAPTAPQAARPLRVRLTSLATFNEDPYHIYAEQVLRLAPLEPLLAQDDPALYGRCFHAIAESMITRFHSYEAQITTELLPTKILPSLVEQQLAHFAPSPFAQAFWREPLLRSAQRLLNRVQALKPQRLWCEVDGKHCIALADGRNLTLSARADLVVETQDGAWWLVDHKTGVLPSAKSLQNLEQPQLVLGAWLLRQGAFSVGGKRLQPTTLPQACYWEFSAKNVKSSELAIDDKIWAKKSSDDKCYETAQAFADACYERYAGLLQHFDREETPYPARVLSSRAVDHDPYRHLARRRAWILEEA